MHANLASFAPLVALGVVFSLAYERTGRISTSIIAHALFNITTTVLVMAGLDV
jgi:membrane protease YdiL (CAAX protease family)